MIRSFDLNLQKHAAGVAKMHQLGSTEVPNYSGKGTNGNGNGNAVTFIGDTILTFVWLWVSINLS